jgi:hypothetical protein
MADAGGFLMSSSADLPIAAGNRIVVSAGRFFCNKHRVASQPGERADPQNAGNLVFRALGDGVAARPLANIARRRV